MPVVDVNCCLCGAPIDETQPWPEWMGRFRAGVYLKQLDLALEWPDHFF